MTDGPAQDEMASRAPHPTVGRHTLKERAQEELRRYLTLSAYLFVCFGVLLLFEATQSEGSRASILHLGTIAGKALIVAKFVLLGDAAGVGTRIVSRTVLQRVVVRTILLAVVLLALTALEEMIVDSLHGRSAADALVELFGTGLPATAAKTLLMLLILAPLVTVTEVSHALGPGSLRRLLRGTPGVTSSEVRGPNDDATAHPPGASAPDRAPSRGAHPRRRE